MVYTIHTSSLLESARYLVHLHLWPAVQNVLSFFGCLGKSDHVWNPPAVTFSLCVFSLKV